MTHADLVAANATIKTTNIKGKQYAEVSERIKAFRMVYPDGSIQTELLSDTDGVCTFRATILTDSGAVLGVGHAQEEKKSSYINKTSYIENCETSAVGRALGMCGFGQGTEVASLDEVINAINNQGGDRELYKCDGCGCDIEDSVGKNGDLWTADNIVTYSMRRFSGKIYCPTCQKEQLKKVVKEEDAALTGRKE